MKNDEDAEHVARCVTCGGPLIAESAKGMHARRKPGDAVVPTPLGPLVITECQSCGAVLDVETMH